MDFEHFINLKAHYWAVFVLGLEKIEGKWYNKK
jgi:hypothetical protein